MKVLVTGSAGFLGRNLCAHLTQRSDITVLEADLDTSPGALAAYCKECDFLVHLAGVNRPGEVHEFFEGNRDALGNVLALLDEANNPVPVVLSSSVQAELDNPYGESKRQGETLLRDWAERRGVPSYIFRFVNLFGKWSRPNYNSAVATFCYNTARGLPIRVNDPAAKFRLLYADDAVEAIVRCLEGKAVLENGFVLYGNILETTVGRVAEIIQSFAADREKSIVPEQGDPLTKDLWATYLSFLPENDFMRPLICHEDARGSFTELLHTSDRGQVSVNISKPGITKGNHWHHTKNEKFIVVSGEAVIRFKNALGGDVIEYRVSGKEPAVVDIPTGYTHSIENVGETDLVTVMWANECFDPERPDTIYKEVAEDGR